MACLGNKGLSNWPCVDYGEGKVDVLRDPRVAETLHKLGMEHLWLPWSFHGEGRLNDPWGMATNSQGQFIVGDYLNVKVFHSSGKFVHSFRPPTVRVCGDIYDVATDRSDNIYVVAHVHKHGGLCLCVFEKTAGLLHIFSLKKGFFFERLTVSENNKVLLLGKQLGRWKYSVVVGYETDGHFFRSFGKGILENPSDITAADGCVMVADCSDTGCVHIFNEEGDHLKKFKLEEGSCEILLGLKTLRIAFHHASGHVLVASKRKVLIYTKDGQFVRSIEHPFITNYIRGIVVSEAGRIAVVSYSCDNVVFLQ